MYRGSTEAGNGGCQKADRERSARRSRSAGFRPGAFCLTLCLAFCLFAAGCFPGVSILGDSSRILLWLSPVALMEAQAGPARRGDEDAERYEADLPDSVEERIRTLLSPVYGADHLVVQVSAGEAGEGARPPLSVAVIVDTAVVHGLPTSAEGLRAEQERLCTLISHAAGLRGERGDSIAVSFLMFSEGRDSLWLWLGCGAGGIALLAVLVLAVRAAGRRTGRTDRSQIPDREPENVRKMTGQAPKSRAGAGRLAARLRGESPQARALALALLDPGLAAAVVTALPEALRAETVLCMASQGPVERDVLELVRQECLQGVDADADSFDGSEDPVLRAAAVLARLEPAVRAQVGRAAAKLQPETWKRLAGYES